MSAVFRRLHAAVAAQPPRLTKLALHAPKSVSLLFPDDPSSPPLLRSYCTLADSCNFQLLTNGPPRASAENPNSQQRAPGHLVVLSEFT